MKVIVNTKVTYMGAEILLESDSVGSSPRDREALEWKAKRFKEFIEKEVGLPDPMPFKAAK